ncbi:hypothetical protein Tco_1379884 [Tanacetum coccineum]
MIYEVKEKSLEKVPDVESEEDTEEDPKEDSEEEEESKKKRLKEELGRAELKPKNWRTLAKGTFDPNLIRPVTTMT